MEWAENDTDRQLDKLDDEAALGKDGDEELTSYEEYQELRSIFESGVEYKGVEDSLKRFRRLQRIEKLYPDYALRYVKEVHSKVAAEGEE